MVWLTMKTGRIGVTLYDACMADARELPRCPPMHPARRCDRIFRGLWCRPLRTGHLFADIMSRGEPGADCTGTHSGNHEPHPLSGAVGLLTTGDLIRVSPHGLPRGRSCATPRSDGEGHLLPVPKKSPHGSLAWTAVPHLASGGTCSGCRCPSFRCESLATRAHLTGWSHPRTSSHASSLGARPSRPSLPASHQTQRKDDRRST